MTAALTGFLIGWGIVAGIVSLVMILALVSWMNSGSH